MRAEIDGAPVKYAGWDAYCDACGRGESEEGNEILLCDGDGCGVCHARLCPGLPTRAATHRT